jgi:hypothetical protein
MTASRAFMRIINFSDRAAFHRRNFFVDAVLILHEHMEVGMGFGRGALFWLIGVPIPIIILLAIFWH